MSAPSGHFFLLGQTQLRPRDKRHFFFGFAAMESEDDSLTSIPTTNVRPITD